MLATIAAGSQGTLTMKHLLRHPRGTAIATAVILGGLALANLAAAIPVHVGVLVGIGVSKLRGVASPVVPFEGLRGACYGLTIRFPVSPMFSVQPEVLAVTDGISWGKLERTDESGYIVLAGYGF